MINLNLYTTPPLLAFLSSSILLFLVLRKNHRSHLHRSFALFLGTMALWGATIFAMRYSPDLTHAYSWQKLAFAIFPLMGVVWYRFTAVFTSRKASKRWDWMVIYPLCIIFVLLALTPLVIKGTQLKFYGYAPILGRLFIVYIIYCYVVFFLGLSYLIKASRTSPSYDERNRAAYISFGMICSFIGLLTDYLPALGVGIYPLGILGNIAFGIITTVAILKYHLLDIHIVIRKGAAYTLFSLVVASAYLAVLLIVDRVIKSRELPLAASLLFLLLFALALQPLLARVQQGVDRLFYRQRYDHLKALEQFTRETRSIIDLQGLATSLVNLVKPAIRATSVCLLIPAQKNEQFIPISWAGLSQPPPIGLMGDSILIAQLRQHDDLLLNQDMEIIPQLKALSSKDRGVLSQLQAEVIVGLRSRGELVGVLVLGAKLSQQLYSEDDLKLLNVVSHQVATTLDNARLYRETARAYEELKETQEQLVQTERLRALGQMASGIAHDFNNLLAGILGRAQLSLVQGKLDDKLKRNLRIIEQAALDGAETIRRLQDFSQVRVDRNFQLLDPHKLAESAAELVEPVMAEAQQTNGTAIALELQLHKVDMVAGNAVEIRQALINMLLNAIAAMPKGGVLTLSTKQEGKQVAISVTDTGTGIPEQIRTKIFEPFFTTKGTRGTGLGLSVSYGIVKRHGGRIDVESEVGKGSTFSIWLPVAGSEEVTAATATSESDLVRRVDLSAVVEQPDSKVKSVPQTNILVVDDNPEMIEVLRLMISELGHQVTAAARGEEGLSLFQQQKHDIVIADLGLPDMSGWDVIKTIKKIKPTTAIIIITGWGVQISAKEKERAGIYSVLTKPFTREQLSQQLIPLLRSSVETKQRVSEPVVRRSSP